MHDLTNWRYSYAEPNQDVRQIFVTARIPEELGRLCSYRCLSVCPPEGTPGHWPMVSGPRSVPGEGEVSYSPVTGPVQSPVAGPSRGDLTGVPPPDQDRETAPPPGGTECQVIVTRRAVWPLRFPHEDFLVIFLLPFFALNIKFISY